MASAAFEAKRNATAATVVWTVHVRFPAFALLSLPELNFYWSTADGIELEDGNTYSRQLVSPPRGRHQRDRANDYAEFQASNPKNELYQSFRDYEDLIEKAEVVIRECYEIETDFYESEIRFVGYLKDFTHDHANYTLNFTAMSDMSRSGFLVANRVLTREKCGTEFNINGALPATDSICGWQTAQGGNSLFCSKLADGVDGCSAHNNLHRFFAVPALATADVQIVSPSTPGIIDGTGDGGIGGTGWSADSGPCFTDKVFMVMNRKLDVLPMNEVQVGMPHLGFDLFDNDRLIDSQVRGAFPHETDHYYNAVFDEAIIQTAKSHLFYLGGRYFAPVGSLRNRPAIGINLRKKPARSDLLSIERVSFDTIFYEFHTSAHNYIVTDKNKQFFYFVHNLKPVLLMA